MLGWAGNLEGGRAVATKPIPEGYHSVTPYLCAKGAAKAIEFYKKALSATERMRITQPDGRVGHAEIQIGDSVIMLSDEFPEMGVRSPETLGGSPMSIHLYVEDADAMFEQAVAAGATVKRPVEDQFYGDRLGGNRRSVWTYMVDIDPQRRLIARRNRKGALPPSVIETGAS
jgi:PhnB protein